MDEACAAVEAGEGDTNLYDTDRRNNVGIGFSFPLPENESIIYNDRNSNDICFLDYECILIYASLFLALSCIVAKADMDTKDANISGAVLDGFCGHSCIWVWRFI